MEEAVVAEYIDNYIIYSEYPLTSEPTNFSERYIYEDMWIYFTKITDEINFAVSMYHDQLYFLDGMVDPFLPIAD